MARQSDTATVIAARVELDERGQVSVLSVEQPVGSRQ